MVLARQDLDLAGAGMLLKSSVPWALIAFHAQQAAEKSLKAYLTLVGVDFPYTHDIQRLLDFCRDSTDWMEVLKHAPELNRYAVAARYPDSRPVVTKAKALEAIKLAEEVHSVVTAAFLRQGVKLGKS